MESPKKKRKIYDRRKIQVSMLILQVRTGVTFLMADLKDRTPPLNYLDRYLLILHHVRSWDTFMAVSYWADEKIAARLLCYDAIELYFQPGLADIIFGWLMECEFRMFLDLVFHHRGINYDIFWFKNYYGSIWPSQVAEYEKDYSVQVEVDSDCSSTWSL